MVIRLIRKLGHVKIEWVPPNLYSELEIRQIHIHFLHTQSNRLFAVMKLANPKAVSPTVYSELENDKASWNICRCESDAPLQFRGSLTNSECVFNRIVLFHIMKLDGKTIRDVVEREKSLLQLDLFFMRLLKIHGRRLFAFGQLG